MSEATFERRLRAALHAPVATDPRTKEAIMARVRADAIASPRPRRRASARRGAVRFSLAGLALAASIGSITTLSMLPHMPADAAGGPVVIGDTVVGTLRDTLRLVRLMFDAPDARRVAVVGDFNDWRIDSAPMRRDPASRRWAATVALRDGVHRYAFVVDGTRWAAPRDPSAVVERSGHGRVYSLLHVARSSN